MGPRGSGKSAILNGISGQGLFALGPATATTATTQTQAKASTQNGDVYFDTRPYGAVDATGIATSEAQSTLDEIKQALMNKNESFKIFFVIRMDTSTAAAPNTPLAEDCYRLNHFLGNIPNLTNQYGVVVNNVPAGWNNSDTNTSALIGNINNHICDPSKKSVTKANLFFLDQKQALLSKTGTVYERLTDISGEDISTWLNSVTDYTYTPSSYIDSLDNFLTTKLPLFHRLSSVSYRLFAFFALCVFVCTSLGIVFKKYVLGGSEQDSDDDEEEENDDGPRKFDPVSKKNKKINKK